MAQVKKKTSTTTKSPAKATVKTKKVTKPRKSTAKATKSEYRTLRRDAPTQPFMTVKPTLQTVYWLIVGAVVLALGIWIVNLQLTINSIYDKIDENQLYYDQISEIDQRVIENKKAIEQTLQPTVQ